MKIALIRVLHRELHRFRTQWVYWFTFIIAPISMFVLIIWLFSAGVIRKLPVTIVDNDHSTLSRKIIRTINASATAKVINQSPSLNDAKLEVENGTVDAVIVIPAELEKGIYKGTTNPIAVYINNTNVVKGGVLKSGIFKTLSTISTGIKIQTAEKQGLTSKQAFERSLPIIFDTHLLFNPYSNYSYFLTLGLLPLMIVVFSFLGTVYVLGLELKENTCGHLLQDAGNSIIITLIGKVLPYTFILFADVAIMNIFLFKVLGTPINGSLYMLFFSEFLLVISYQMMAIFILALTANMRLTLSLGSAYTMMALTFSGLTFPVIGMPIFAKVFSYLFPYSFWIRLFIGQTLRGEQPSDGISNILALCIFILLGILAIPRLKKVYNEPKFWGRI